MKEQPILFTGPMVRAILDGSKTQTRRPVKPQPPKECFLTRMQDGFTDGIRPVFGFHDEPNAFSAKSPFGTIGDQLWVREAFSLKDSNHEDSPNVVYRANQDSGRMVWTPSIHMPRWASRIDLEITSVRVERVQDITEEDARKEGMESLRDQCESLADFDESMTDRDLFKALWQSIYANWDANPWVWVYEFRRIKP